MEIKSYVSYVEKVRNTCGRRYFRLLEDNLNCVINKTLDSGGVA